MEAQPRRSSRTSTRRRGGLAPPGRDGRFAAFIDRYRFAILAYVGTRVLLIVVAIIDGWIHTRSFTHEIGNWDGYWYHLLAETGYPTTSRIAQTVLGFFPLYSIVIWLVTPLVFGSAVTAGFVISMIGGLIATVLVQRLATGWWDEAAGRRAAVLFCVFPGSVVFSMVYSEGLLLPLRGRLHPRARATAMAVRRAAAPGSRPRSSPTRSCSCSVCAVAALLELRRQGWRDPAARRSLLAPLLSLTGVAAFAIFLWAGPAVRPRPSPPSTTAGTRRPTRSRSSHLVTRLAHQIARLALQLPTINLNYAGRDDRHVRAGRRDRADAPASRPRPDRGAAVDARGRLPDGHLRVRAAEPATADHGLPAIIVFARYLEGRRFKWLIVVMVLLLIELSALTFVGVTLRP